MKLDKDFYKLSEVKEILGVTLRTIYRYIETEQLNAVKFGGQWRVSKDELGQFMKGGK